jgi:hypothetical protein
VAAKDVLQTGYYLTLLGPSFVYVRYRCNRCKRVGEQLIPEDKWDPTVLEQPGEHLDEGDRSRFSHMGRIGPDEILDFHLALESLKSLPED